MKRPKPRKTPTKAPSRLVDAPKQVEAPPVAPKAEKAPPQPLAGWRSVVVLPDPYVPMDWESVYTRLSYPGKMKAKYAAEAEFDAAVEAAWNRAQAERFARENQQWVRFLRFARTGQYARMRGWLNEAHEELAPS